MQLCVLANDQSALVHWHQPHIPVKDSENLDFLPLLLQIIQKHNPLPVKEHPHLERSITDFHSSHCKYSAVINISNPPATWYCGYHSSPTKTTMGINLHVGSLILGTSRSKLLWTQPHSKTGC